MLKKIIELISKKDFKRLKALLEDSNNADISDVLEELPGEDAIIIFRLMPKSEAADIFAYMEPDANFSYMDGDTLIVKTSSQSAFNDQRMISHALGLKFDKVVVETERGIQLGYSTTNIIEIEEKRNNTLS